MELWRHSPLILWAAALLCASCLQTASAGASLRRQRVLRAGDSEAADASSGLEGVRRCLGLAPGEELEVTSSKQRYGQETFLVAHPPGRAKPVGQTALQATYESLLRGGGCDEKASAQPGSKQHWFVDVGSNDAELMALASSVGCGVSVLDADIASARAEEMTGCLDKDKDHPVKVFRLLASNVDGPIAKVSSPEASAPANSSKHSDQAVTLDSMFENPQVPGPSSAQISVLKLTPPGESDQTLRALEGAEVLLQSGRVHCLVTHMNFDLNSTEALISKFSVLENNGYHFAHLGALDYPSLDITDDGTYPLFHTDSKQLKELFDSYKKIRAFDERAGFRVYSGSLSLDRNGHYFDYTDFIVACRDNFPDRIAVREKGKARFSQGAWWLEKAPGSK